MGRPPSSQLRHVGHIYHCTAHGTPDDVGIIKLATPLSCVGPGASGRLLALSHATTAEVAAVIRARAGASCLQMRPFSTGAPDVEPTLNPSEVDATCRVCGREEPADKLMLCHSFCGQGLHWQPACAGRDAARLGAGGARESLCAELSAASADSGIANATSSPARGGRGTISAAAAAVAEAAASALTTAGGSASAAGAARPQRRGSGRRAPAGGGSMGRMPARWCCSPACRRTVDEFRREYDQQRADEGAGPSLDRPCNLCPAAPRAGAGTGEVQPRDFADIWHFVFVCKNRFMAELRPVIAASTRAHMERLLRALRQAVTRGRAWYPGHDSATPLSAIQEALDLVRSDPSAIQRDRHLVYRFLLALPFPADIIPPARATLAPARVATAAAAALPGDSLAPSRAMGRVYDAVTLPNVMLHRFATLAVRWASAQIHALASARHRALDERRRLVAPALSGGLSLEPLRAATSDSGEAGGEGGDADDMFLDDEGDPDALAGLPAPSIPPAADPWPTQ